MPRRRAIDVSEGDVSALVLAYAAARVLQTIWREDCTSVARAEEAKSNEGEHQIMANSAKPVKKGKKLSSAKKLEKKTTLTKFHTLTNRFPVS